MNSSTLTEGVRPGSVTDKHQIIILICYILNEIHEPITVSQLRDTLVTTQLVNYFTFSDILVNLVKLGHILPTTNDQSQLTLTQTGRQTSETLHMDLPPAVKERGTLALEKILIFSKQTDENQIQIIPTDDGATIKLSLTDDDLPLLALTLFLPNKETAHEVAKNFAHNQLGFYNKIIDFATSPNHFETQPHSTCQHTINSESQNGQHIVSLTIPDGNITLFSISILLPTEELSHKLTQKFQTHTVDFYNGITSIATAP